jgi:inorganic triphosphatase YgiF
VQYDATCSGSVKDHQNLVLFNENKAMVQIKVAHGMNSREEEIRVNIWPKTSSDEMRMARMTSRVEWKAEYMLGQDLIATDRTG